MEQVEKNLDPNHAGLLLLQLKPRSATRLLQDRQITSEVNTVSELPLIRAIQRFHQLREVTWVRRSNAFAPQAGQDKVRKYASVAASSREIALERSSFNTMSFIPPIAGLKNGSIVTVFSSFR